MDFSTIDTIDELIAAIDEYFRSPKRPGVTGSEANAIFKKMVELLEKQTNTYDDIAERDADATVRDGIYGFVIDASADAEVEAGQSALYIYKLAEWKRVAIVDDLNVTLEWANITGKPESTPEEIDNAVAKSKFTETFTVNFPNNTTGLPNGTVVTAGTEIEPTFRQMLRKASPPTYTQPTVSLSSSPSENGIEAGTVLDIILDSIFTQNDAGASSSVSIKKDGVEIATAEPYTDEDVVITETPKVYTATYVYAQGPIKNDSLGSPDATGRVSAGSKTTSAKTYTGYRDAFVGFIAATSSAIIRAFTDKFRNAVNGSVITVTIPAGAARVVISYKATLRDLTKVEYVEDSNKNITGNFTKLSNLDVEGANAFTAIAYKRFEFIPVEPFPSAVTYKFTI
jgi:hypothetical protein